MSATAMAQTQPETASEELPELRSDLIISRHQQSSGTIYVVKDPRARRYFKLGELEHFIATNLDGETPLSEVGERLQAELGAAYPADKIAAFAARLHQLGLLRQSEPVQPRSEGASLLFLKLKAFDPDRLLAFLSRYTRPLFTRWFAILVLGLLLGSMVAMSGSWSELAVQTRSLMRPAFLPLAFLVFLAIAVAHELAHGLTCKHFGGEVHEMGLLLVFLIPAVYCDVSDSWLFTDKARKLWVSFAGVFIQLFIWSIAVLAWQLSGGITWLSDLLCLTIVICGITAVLNLNPLIRLDGYYLLSDLLEQPNLRRESFRYLGQLAGTIIGRSGRRRPITTRQRWIYISYGISAGVFSLALLLVIPLQTTAALAARLSWPVALVIAGAVLTTTTVLQLRRRRGAPRPADRQSTVDS
jgi:putative peptide zinc metalloprotease protein